MELLSPAEIVRLSAPERIELIAQLWDSLDSENAADRDVHQLPLTLEQQAELENRLLTLDQDRRAGTTWADLRAELRQRCRQV